MQKGGEEWAHKTLTSFFGERGKSYAYTISKPEDSRKSCSRMSPYLAWGNISIRFIYHSLKRKKHEPQWKLPARALGSRLRWHCHFIQKFESEHEMEIRHLNRDYDGLPFKVSPDSAHFNAWFTGQTGFPLVDACNF